MAEHDDIERWSRRLAGRGDGTGAGAGEAGDVEADELGRAIRAEDAACVSADAIDRVGLERLMRRLEAEGLIETSVHPRAAESTHQRTEPAHEGTQPLCEPSSTRQPEAPSRRRWTPWLAVAATLATVAVGLRLLMPPAGPGSPAGPAGPGTERPRGFAGVVKLVAADPDAKAGQLALELEALGLEPALAPSDGRVVLEFDVPAGQLDGYRAWAEPYGGRAEAPGRYRVIVESSVP